MEEDYGEHPDNIAPSEEDDILYTECCNLVLNIILEKYIFFSNNFYLQEEN